MKNTTKHRVNMLQLLYRLKLISREEVIEQLNSEPLRTWQRVDQISKILNVEALYNFKNGES